jgi:hypothetical protein
LIKSKFAIVALTFMVFSFVVVPVLADSIRISPSGDFWGSVMVATPATFYANVTNNNDAGTYDVHLFMVIPQSCYDSLTGTVTVDWDAGSNGQGSWTAGTASVAIGDWNGPETENSKKIPPAAKNGYTVASLQDHLRPEEPLYWAFVAILDGAKLEKQDPGIPFTVTLPADEPKMGLWLIGKNPGSDELDNQTPTTKPGFVIPEPATIFLATSSLLALGLYAYRRKDKQ